MGTAAAPGTVGEQRHRARGQSLGPGELAWLALLPCAAVVVLAILLLGPPLGDAFLGPGSDRFWPEAIIRPEPVEHARFLLALLGPPLLAAVTIAGAGRVRVRPGAARAAIFVSQLVLLAVLALTLLAQHDILFRSHYVGSALERLFTLPTVLASAAVALAAAVALSRPAAMTRLAAAARETPRRRAACAGVAVLLIAIWLSAAFNTERSVGLAEANHLIPWDMSETFAVLNGRTPLVDFHSQYAQLIPYLAALPMGVFGASVGTWIATMIVLSALALLAVYALLRRVVRSSVAALALFLLFVAASGFVASGRLSSFEIFSVWPMRYGPAYLLAWLTARHLDGVAPRRRWLLLAAGALVALNNLEFGLAALGGTLAAIALVDPPRSRRAALRLLGDAGIGLLLALLLVSGLSLAHGGALPNFALLLEFPRIYGVGGWVLEPMTAIGFHVAVYLTLAAAIVAAAVRAVRGATNPVLTGMLVWSGIFGLGAGSYYAGRSNVLDLVVLFSAWCLSLVLLTVVVVEALAAGARRPGLAELAVLFGCGLAACAIFNMPRPWTEVGRVQRETAPVYAQQAATRLVSGTTRPDERVAILIPLGHRIAYDAEVVDVSPYASGQAMPTANQLETTLDAMRDAGAAKVYVDTGTTYPALIGMLDRAGYAPSIQAGPYVMLRRSSR